MTNKNILLNGRNYKVYTRCFDEENIYLQFEGFEFSTNDDSVTVAIPLNVWENLRKVDGISQLDLVNMSDSEIEKKVVEEVDGRIRELSLFGKEDNMAKLIKMENYLVYGDANDSKDNQIKKGLSFYLEQRERQKAIINKINS